MHWLMCVVNVCYISDCDARPLGHQTHRCVFFKGWERWKCTWTI